MTDAALSQSDSSARGARSGRPWVLIVVLLVCGFFGEWAAGALTIDKITTAADPSAALDCNFSVLVQCGKNLGSWQGAAFGFPNPILGVACWAAPIVVAMALIAGARFANWFWWLFNVGHAFALGFCIWLMSQSVFDLGTLCPWCMLTWAVSILSFWVLTGHNLREGRFGAWGVGLGRFLVGWWPLVTLVSYLIIALIAQLRLDYLSML